MTSKLTISYMWLKSVAFQEKYRSRRKWFLSGVIFLPFKSANDVCHRSWMVEFMPPHLILLLVIFCVCNVVIRKYAILFSTSKEHVRSRLMNNRHALQRTTLWTFFSLFCEIIVEFIYRICASPKVIVNEMEKIDVEFGTSFAFFNFNISTKCERFRTKINYIWYLCDESDQCGAQENSPSETKTEHDKIQHIIYGNWFLQKS